MNTNHNSVARPILRKVARAAATVLPFLAALSLIATGASATATTATTASLLQDLEGKAISQVAEHNRVAPGELTVVNSAKAEYPLQGKSFYEYKIADKRSGTIYGVAFDVDGKDVDTTKVRADEEAAYSARYGKLEPELADLLPGIPAKQAISVTIWLKEPGYVGPQKPTSDAQASEAQIDAFYAQADAQRAAAMRKVVGPVAGRMAQLGYATTGDPYTPMLYAALTPSAIQQISAWSEVDRVYLSRTYEPTVNSGRNTIKADVVNARGYTGVGIKLGVTEVGGGAQIANPFLLRVVPDPLNACVTSHSTGVAGIMVSIHPIIRGIAPGARVMVGGSCGGWSAQLTAASTRAANWGARAINLSWGTTAGATAPDNALARFYDNMVFTRDRTIVTAAGNRGFGDRLLVNPALAYNAITVGSFDDQHNPTWADVISGFSSYKNPTTPHGDREKPEVAAPGSSINSTITSTPWTGNIGSGTSYAAPMVTGSAGLLIQRKPLLAIWPETLKAILMATAKNNVDTNFSFPFTPGVDTKDGAGGIAIDRADDIAHGVNGNSGSQPYNCAAPNLVNVATMALTSGVRTRVVTTWHQNPGYTSYSSQPSADLDLNIIGPGGALVAGSGSWDNNFEIVEFTPTVTGNYTIQVSKYGCALTPGYVGWAWYKGN
jgi:hypothetical protein